MASRRVKRSGMEINMKKNSIKYSRMNGEVQKELSKIISRDIKDPRIHPMTSVVSVDVTPDLKFAKVFVSVLGNDEDKEKTRKGLTSASSHIRSLLAKSLNLRNTPELTFVIDDSIEYGVSMSKKIADVTSTLHDRELAEANVENEENDEE